ncbi:MULTISPECIES: hypothetical protein [Asaia]
MTSPSAGSVSDRHQRPSHLRWLAGQAPMVWMGIPIRSVDSVRSEKL